MEKEVTFFSKIKFAIVLDFLNFKNFIRNMELWLKSNIKEIKIIIQNVGNFKKRLYNKAISMMRGKSPPSELILEIIKSNNSLSF